MSKSRVGRSACDGARCAREWAVKAAVGIGAAQVPQRRAVCAEMNWTRVQKSRSMVFLFMFFVLKRRDKVIFVKLAINAAKVIRSWEKTKQRECLIVLGHITDHLILVVKSTHFLTSSMNMGWVSFYNDALLL